jgi:hypothetical protein
LIVYYSMGEFIGESDVSIIGRSTTRNGTWF